MGQGNEDELINTFTETPKATPSHPASIALGHGMNAGVDTQAHHHLHMLAGGVQPHNTGRGAGRVFGPRVITHLLAGLRRL